MTICNLLPLQNSHSDIINFMSRCETRLMPMGEQGNPVHKTTGAAMVSGNPLADGCCGAAVSSEYTYTGSIFFF
jgi:hypothetical protein